MGVYVRCVDKKNVYFYARGTKSGKLFTENLFVCLRFGSELTV